MNYIFVLELENEKYFICKTDCDDIYKYYKKTYNYVFNKKNPFRSVVDMIEVKSEFDEVNITLEYMNRYGIKNVRGGPWKETTYSHQTYIDIERILRNVYG